jgi:hypothetical protein
MTNATNWDAGDPHAPSGFATWGEQISDDVDTLNDAVGTFTKQVYNGTGSTIAAGTLVEIDGAAGAVSTIRVADAGTAISVDGITVEAIAAATVGTIQIGGTVEGLNTSGLTSGSPLWLGTAGAFTDTAPSADAIIRVGKVGVVAPTGGTVVLDLPAFELAGDEVAFDPGATDLTETRVGPALRELADDVADVVAGILPINVQTASYTLVLADGGKTVEMNVGTANDLTVPPNSSVAFPVGTVIEICQVGAGQTTVVAGSGVDVRSPETLVLAGQWSTVSLRKRATDEWVLAGDVEASA